MARSGTGSPVTTVLNPASFGPVTAAAETNLWTPDIWTPIPANDADPLIGYKVSFGGIIQTRSSSIPSLIFTPRWGQSATPANNVLLGASGAITPTVLNANSNFYGEFTVVIRSLGTGATATGNGFVTAWSATTALTSFRWVMGGTIATVDTTVAGGLIVALTYSNANASNTCTCQWVNLMSIDGSNR